MELKKALCEAASKLGYSQVKPVQEEVVVTFRKACGRPLIQAVVITRWYADCWPHKMHCIAV